MERRLAVILAVRIGVNLGEVIVKGDDRYGEGVNIATRLEQIAEAFTVTWPTVKPMKNSQRLMT